MLLLPNPEGVSVSRLEGVSLVAHSATAGKATKV